MKKVLLLATLFVVLLFINLLIFKKEETISKGHTILLRLAPRDPRSLIQGDYMALQYELAREIPASQLKNKGKIVVSVDNNKVAKFLRVYNGENLADGEYLLTYRKGRGLKLGAESFMFQEGDVQLYSSARYSELKVDPSGASVLVGLYGEDFKRLGKKSGICRK